MTDNKERAKTTARAMARDHGKVSQASVHYQDAPKGDKRCGRCTMFRKPNGCTLVRGDIKPYGYCVEFKARARKFDEGGVAAGDAPDAAPDTGMPWNEPAATPQAQSETMGKVVSGLSKQIGNAATELYGQATLPGDVYQGNYNIPAAPQMSEEDAYRLNQANDTIGNRAVGLAQNITLGSMPMAEEGAIGAGGGKLITPEGYAIPGKDYSRVSRDTLQDIAAGPKGAGPIDLASQQAMPSVEQVPLPRYEPARGVSPRMKQAIDNSVVQKGMLDSMRAGQGVGADKWYHTEPIRQAWLQELGPVQGPKAFAQFMDHVAATSPKSAIPENIRTASYYYQHALNNKNLPQALPYPYGSVAQGLHRQNFDYLTGRHGVGAEATPGWDVYRNPKPASFSQNLQGNLQPVTADTHAFRNIGMRTGDPRFLETSIREKLKPGASLSERQQQYGERKGNIVTYRPRQLVEKGRLSMQEAHAMPPFWASQPSENEYGAVENLYSNIAARAKLRPAEGQSAAWSGAGALTGLGSPPSHTFSEAFNERVLYTARMRGEHPEQTLRDAIRGTKPLLHSGGDVQRALRVTGKR